MGKLQGSNTSTLEGILADAASKQPHPLVTVIVYDLPNRDCHAKASNGEICCVPNPDGTCNYDSAGDGTCSSGLATYVTATTMLCYVHRAPQPVFVFPW